MNQTFQVLLGVFSGVIIGIGAPLLLEWIKRKYQKSKLLSKEIKFFKQNSGGVYRLILANNGEFQAKSVEVNVTKIWDGRKLRSNFVPAPLWWTHKTETIRDIFPHQIVYLDILNVGANAVNSFLSIAAPNILTISEMSGIKQGSTTIELQSFQENDQTNIFQFHISWDGEIELDPPKIKVGII